MATQFTPDDDAIGVRIVFHHSGIGLVGYEIDMGVGPGLSDRGSLSGHRDHGAETAEAQKQV